MRWRFPAAIVLFGAVLVLTTPVRFAMVWAGEAPASAAPASVEERRLLTTLNEERSRLQAEYQRRGQKLDQREIELKTLAEEVDKKISELRKIQESVQQLLQEKRSVEAKRIKNLSRMYAKMTPAQAARLLTDLDQDLAVAILAAMAPKSGAKIMNNLPVGVATSLSQAYSSLETR